MHRLVCALVVSAAVEVLAAVEVRAQSNSCPTTAPYVLLSGTDTLSIERLDLTDSTFFSRVDAVAQNASLKFGGRVNANGLVDSMSVEIWQSSRVPTGPADQHATVVFSSSGAQALVAAPGRAPQLQHDATPPGTLPYMANAGLFLELITRRAMREPNDTDQVPILWLFTGGEIDSARVTVRGDRSLSIAISSVTYMMERTVNDRLLRAEVQMGSGEPATRARLVRQGCDGQP